ncbi:P-loop NTPase family protein [Galactobacter caseinivorans]|uniref:hypothetical protein n=1 Tax=Galactobacter caseinivorans TaxID=2676123 RepID=UPI003899487A
MFGTLTTYRAADSAGYPARFKLVNTANRCPRAKKSRPCGATPLCGVGIERGPQARS